MITYLLDTSVIVEFYRPQSSYNSAEELAHSRELCSIITAQQASDQAILFVPSFCIAEVKNTFAKWHFRKKVFESAQHYSDCLALFTKHVSNRHFFYSYDLNRYHNINCDMILPIEHTCQTEFVVSGLPIGASQKQIKKKLMEKRIPYDHGRYYLSSFDILIISMGMELKRTMAKEVHLLTNDYRLHLIAEQDTAKFPKSYYWSETSKEILDGLAPIVSSPKSVKQ